MLHIGDGVNGLASCLDRKSSCRICDIYENIRLDMGIIIENVTPVG